MSEDAPVNTGAVAWPDPDSADVVVRRMQTKLHRWAIEKIPPAGSVTCSTSSTIRRSWCTRWERVSTNKGARTAGIDKATATQVETRVGVGAFLGQLRDALKSGEFRPVEVRQAMIPKGNREIPQAGYSHHR